MHWETGAHDCKTLQNLSSLSVVLQCWQPPAQRSGHTNSGRCGFGAASDTHKVASLLLTSSEAFNLQKYKDTFRVSSSIEGFEELHSFQTHQAPWHCNTKPGALATCIPALQLMRAQETLSCVMPIK